MVVPPSGNVCPVLQRHSGTLGPCHWSPRRWGWSVGLVDRQRTGGKVKSLWDFDETLAERPDRWWGCMLEIIGRRHPGCVADEQA